MTTSKVDDIKKGHPTLIRKKNMTKVTMDLDAAQQLTTSCQTIQHMPLWKTGIKS